MGKSRAPYPGNVDETALETVELAVWSDIFERAERISRDGAIRRLAFGDVIVTQFPEVDVLAFNRALGIGLEKEASPDLLDEIVGVFRDAGCARCMIPLAHMCRPADLQSWLIERGFYHHNNWIRLVRDPAAPPDAPTDLRIGALSAADGPAFADLVVTAFEWPEALRQVFATSVGAPGWAHVGAWDGDRLVAVGGMFVHGAVAWLGPAATAPEARGRGAQSALIAERLRAGADLGVNAFTVETAEPKPDHDVPSHRNLRRLGFEIAYRRPNWVCVLRSDLQRKQSTSEGRT